MCEQERASEREQSVREREGEEKESKKRQDERKEHTQRAEKTYVVYKLISSLSYSSSLFFSLVFSFFVSVESALVGIFPNQNVFLKNQHSRQQASAEREYKVNHCRSAYAW